MEPKKKKSRSGRHPDDYVLLGGMVPPKKKAIAMVTAAVIAGHRKLNVLDLIWEGVENTARSVGVIDSAGEVTEKFRDAVTLAEYTIGVNQAKAREKLNAKRRASK